MLSLHPFGRPVVPEVYSSAHSLDSSIGCVARGGACTALGGAAVLLVRFIRYGMGAVRPRTQIEGSEPDPDLNGDAPRIPQPGDGAGAPAERSTRA